MLLSIGNNIILISIATVIKIDVPVLLSEAVPFDTSLIVELIDNIITSPIAKLGPIV